MVENTIKVRKDLYELMQLLEKQYFITLDEIISLVSLLLENHSKYKWQDSIGGEVRRVEVDCMQRIDGDCIAIKVNDFNESQISEMGDASKKFGHGPDLQSSMHLFLQSMKYIARNWEAGFILRDGSSNPIGSNMYKRIYPNDSPLMMG